MSTKTTHICDNCGKASSAEHKIASVAVANRFPSVDDKEEVIFTGDMCQPCIQSIRYALDRRKSEEATVNLIPSA